MLQIAILAEGRATNCMVRSSEIYGSDIFPYQSQTGPKGDPVSCKMWYRETYLGGTAAWAWR